MATAVGLYTSSKPSQMKSRKYLGRLARGSRGSDSFRDGSRTVAFGEGVVTPAARADVGVPASGFVGRTPLIVKTLARLLVPFLNIPAGAASTVASSSGCIFRFRLGLDVSGAIVIEETAFPVTELPEIVEFEVTAPGCLVAKLSIQEDDSLMDVLCGAGKEVHDVLPVPLKLSPTVRENEYNGFGGLGPCGDPV